MIEILVVILVVGAAMIVFHPVLAGAGRSPAGRGAGPGEDERAALLERKERLLRNLRELEGERAAGRIAQADYEALRRRDQIETARVLQQLDALAQAGRGSRKAPRRQPATGPAPEPAGRRLTRALAWAGGVAVFGAILALTMSRAVAPRAPGGTITGTMPGGPGAEAPGGGGAAALLPSVNPGRLMELEAQLRSDPDQVPLLLEAGHLYIAEQRFGDAAEVTMRALDLDRGAAEGYAHIAVLLFAESSTHEDADSARTALNNAIQAVNYALQLNPELAEGWLFKGMIFMAGARDPETAVQAWEQYLKVAPPGADTTRIAAIVRQMK